MITNATANIVSITFTILYISGFYLFENSRANGIKLSRQHPTVIKSRMKAVTFSCIVTFVLLYSLFYYYLPNVRKKEKHYYK